MTEGVCDLCGLSLRHGVFTLDAAGETHRFCCMGCRQVFVMLANAADAGDPGTFRDTELFRTCVAMGIVPASQSDLARRAGDVDDGRSGSTPGTAAEQATIAPESDGAGRLKLTLEVSGMWCPACAWVIETSLKRHDGVSHAACDFVTDRVRLSYDPVATSPDRILDAIHRLGYRGRRPGGEAAETEKKRAFVRFGVASFLTMNVMMLSFALYSGFFTRMSPEAVRNLSWPMFFMAGIVLVYGGGEILRRAWTGVAGAAPGMETLIAVGAVSAFLFSTYNLWTGSIHLYFDTACMLVTLVLLGKILERRAKDAVQRDLGSFFALRPKKVRLCTDARPRGRFVDAEHLRKGDVFRVDDGEIVAADGVLSAGTGLVDESAITGESRPVAKRVGDPVKSGTRVIGASMDVRALRVGEDAILGQMIAIMERALSERMPLEGKTDRILRWFVPVVIGLAAATGIVGRLAGQAAPEAMIRAITVLVISCPCALGIAVPLARVAGVSLSGGQGILVRRFSAFERAERVDTVVFDKTGTLTEGRWRMLGVRTREGVSMASALSLAAGLEQGADHPIAFELIRQTRLNGAVPAAVTDIVDHGNGRSGRWRGRTVRIGARVFVDPQNASKDRWDAVAAEAGQDDAVVSRVYLEAGGRPLAAFAFGDRIKPGAQPAIQKLRQRGIDMALISGDSARATAQVGRRLDIDSVLGGQSPRSKADFIRALQGEHKTVAMVGDGVNDAPALATADLAVAVHSGYPLGKEAADITLMRGDPGQVLEFADLARRVNRKIHQNLVCALVYNVTAIPIAMAGLLTPLVAVCAMLLSSLSVIGNTLMLLGSRRPAKVDRRAREPVRSVLLLAALLAPWGLPPGAGVLHAEPAPPRVAGCAVLPADNVWNTAVDTLPVDVASDLYVATIGADSPAHADFGSGLWAGGPIGIPFVDVPGSQPLVDVAFGYDDESDPGPYPIPADAPIEGGAESDGDRHVLVVDRDNCVLYEMYRAFHGTRRRLASRVRCGFRSRCQRPEAGRVDLRRRGGAADPARAGALRRGGRRRDPPRTAVHRAPDAKGLSLAGPALCLEPDRAGVSTHGTAVSPPVRLCRDRLSRPCSSDPAGPQKVRHDPCRQRVFVVHIRGAR